MDADTDEKRAAWLEKHREQMAFLETAPRQNIGLPHDGESFNDPDLQSFLDRLLALRKAGYYVPESAIEQVREEIRETT